MDERTQLIDWAARNHETKWAALQWLHDAAVIAERERWIAACNTVADGAEKAGRPGAQTVAQVRRLAIDGPNVRIS